MFFIDILRGSRETDPTYAFDMLDLDIKLQKLR